MIDTARNRRSALPVALFLAASLGCVEAEPASPVGSAAAAAVGPTCDDDGDCCTYLPGCMWVFPMDPEYDPAIGGDRQCGMIHGTYCGAAYCSCTALYDGDEYVTSECRRTDTEAVGDLGPCAVQNGSCVNTGGTFEGTCESGIIIAAGIL